MNAFQQCAAEFAAVFVQGKDHSRSPFTHLERDAPGWMKDAVREAHSDRLPDNGIYTLCENAADFIHDGDFENADDAGEQSGEFADNQVDVYDSDRADWMAAHHGNAAEVDEAVAEFGHSAQGIYGDIGAGQYRQAEAVYHVIVRAIQAASEDSDDDDDDDDDDDTEALI